MKVKKNCEYYFDSVPQRKISRAEFQALSEELKEIREYPNEYGNTPIMLFDDNHVQYTLDLHGFTGRSAIDATNRFMGLVKKYRLPTVRIVYGKGNVISKTICDYLFINNLTSLYKNGYVDIDMQIYDDDIWQHYYDKPVSLSTAPSISTSTGFYSYPAPLLSNPRVPIPSNPTVSVVSPSQSQVKIINVANSSTCSTRNNVPDDKTQWYVIAIMLMGASIFLGKIISTYYCHNNQMFASHQVIVLMVPYIVLGVHASYVCIKGNGDILKAIFVIVYWFMSILISPIFMIAASYISSYTSLSLFIATSVMLHMIPNSFSNFKHNFIPPAATFIVLMLLKDLVVI